ncbi:MAG: DUF262 domain-containing protein [Caldilinea sp. CFX5]|nr:DUF262 domain-containing protein [Caldilinea sp. CFX5]
MSGSTFDTSKTPLQDLLRNIHTGKMQLPDFQRGWVWDDDRIRSLLASIAVSFPIGAVMLLETGGEGVRFKPRPVEGAQVSPSKEPEILILDGQQRFTSLYQALMLQTPVQTTNLQKKKIERYYYFDMAEMVNGDPDEESAILSIPADRQVKSDFGRKIELDVTTSQLEYQNHLFPVHRVFDSADWRTGYQEFWGYAPEKMRLFNEFERQIIKRFEQYHIPVIQLNKSTPKEAVCLVFEKVNTGGVPLNVFELLTATFAAENFQLRDDWEGREKRMKSQHRALGSLQNDDFLQAITLLVTQSRRQRAIAEGITGERLPGISCKRRDILRLTLADYCQWADAVEQGFMLAARFLHSQNIYRAVDLPYRTQLVPLAAVFVTLDKEAESASAQSQLARWYWCGVLGELYGGAVESRFARDLPELVDYVRNRNVEPKTIQDANVDANRLLSLRTRNSAAYKGIHALLMRAGCRDFRTGETITMQTFFDDAIDIHHIFPQKWCIDTGVDEEIYNSIVNKTAIAARTNRIIGGLAPSLYLARIEADAKLQRAELSQILVSHGIRPDLLYSDNFTQFFAHRGRALVALIEEAMGKPVAQEGADFLAPPAVAKVEAVQPAWQAESPRMTTENGTRKSESPVNINLPTPPPPFPLAELEKQFHQTMLTVYQAAKRELNYSATYFLQMISEHGGLAAARRLLAKRELSDGFTELYLKGRLDLTVEAQVTRPEFRALFTPDEIATAEKRLTDLGYKTHA